jgi:hypothetical protein
MSLPYRKIVANHRRNCPHQVPVQNGDDWREQYLADQHHAVTGGPLVQWYENGVTVYGFTSAEQAAAFKAWVDGCGIDWSTRPRAGPIPDFVKPPARPSPTR